MYYLGRLDLMEGKVDEAILKLTIAASDPPFPDTPYYLGFAYFKKRDWECPHCGGSIISEDEQE